MRRVVAAFILIAAGAFVACGSGSSNEPTLVPSAEQTARPTLVPTPNATSHARRSGIDIVDKVISAVEAKDIARLKALLRYTDVPCQTHQPTSIPIVSCTAGRPEGSPAPALLSMSCEGTGMQEANGMAERLLSSVVGAHDGVYAVYRWDPPAISPSFPTVGYAVMLTYTGNNGGVSGYALLLNDQGIVGDDVDCGFPPDQMADFDHFGEKLLPPP